MFSHWVPIISYRETLGWKYTFHSELRCCYRESVAIIGTVKQTRMKLTVASCRRDRLSLCCKERLTGMPDHHLKSVFICGLIKKKETKAPLA